MDYVNPPERLPPNVTHHTFYSALLRHELGYNVYLPPDGGEGCPVAYHLHGWQGNESSEIWPMAEVCAARRAITVFPNSSPVIGTEENLPVEAMLIDELIPHIEATYRASGEGRSISGFSMGGGMAFYCAAKHPGLFASVTAYAGTYHHFYHKAYRGVGEPRDKALALYEDMMQHAASLDEGNIMSIVRQNADRLRGHLRIAMRIGADDPLICDSEIMHLYLNAMNIPHEYRIFGGVGHTLADIV